MPAALARLQSEPVPWNASRYTPRSRRSRFTAAARLMGSTSSLEATHTSSIASSLRRNPRASSADVNRASQSCAARFSPDSPNRAGWRMVSESAHSTMRDIIARLLPPSRRLRPRPAARNTARTIGRQRPVPERGRATPPTSATSPTHRLARPPRWRSWTQRALP